MTPKKILYSILLGTILLPVSTYAALDFEQPAGGITEVSDVIERLLTPVWEIFVGVSVIAFVTAGVLFLSANGDPNKISTARNAVLWGTIGIIVGILAFSIMSIVKTIIGG